MRKRLLLFILVGIILFGSRLEVGAQLTDSQKLGRAIDYFQSAKYHEAMLLLQQLDGKYNLNPRYRAYLGVCYYYEWQYDKSCTILDSVIPSLAAYAPHERAVYYYTNAESHFQLSEYAKAIPYYEQMLSVCFDNEKAATYYRLGMCHTFLHDWQHALPCFESALPLYEKYQLPDSNQRKAQIRHMIAGCKEKLKTQLNNAPPAQHSLPNSQEGSRAKETDNSPQESTP